MALHDCVLLWGSSLLAEMFWKQQNTEMLKYKYLKVLLQCSTWVEVLPEHRTQIKLQPCVNTDRSSQVLSRAWPPGLTPCVLMGCQNQPVQPRPGSVCPPPVNCSNWSLGGTRSCLDKLPSASHAATGPNTQTERKWRFGAESREMFCCGTSPTEKCIFVSVVKLMFYNRLINHYGRLGVQSLLINPPELLGSSLRSVNYHIWADRRLTTVPHCR